MKSDIEKVLEYFQNLNNIPRESKNEGKVIDYLEKWADDNNFESQRDEAGNIVIRKEASDGCSGKEGVILQGHADMVAEKEEGKEHDFKKDPIINITEGDILKADRTTLGADNGIAVAMAQVIFEDNTLKHPSLELLVTVDEETEMTGALNLGENMLKGKYLINIDSEEEGILTMGSAGGELLTLNLPFEKEENLKNAYRIIFSGFPGGHSGMMINDNRGNMIKVMAEFFKILSENHKVRLSAFDSGTKDNSIPRDGFIILTTDMSEEETEHFVKDTEKNLSQKFSVKDGKLKITVQKTDSPENSVSEESSEKLMDMLLELPHGVVSMEKADDSLVETSANLAILKTEEKDFKIQLSTRSSVDQKIKDLRNKAAEISRTFGADFKDSGAYPGWAYREDSLLRDTVLKTYKEITGKDMETIIIHAGLECGAIMEKYPDLDAVSIGPDIEGAHTPGEKMSISSAERVLHHIRMVLQDLCR